MSVNSLPKTVCVLSGLLHSSRCGPSVSQRDSSPRILSPAIRRQRSHAGFIRYHASRRFVTLHMSISCRRWTRATRCFSHIAQCDMLHGPARRSNVDRHMYCQLS